MAIAQKTKTAARAVGVAPAVKADPATPTKAPAAASPATKPAAAREAGDTFRKKDLIERVSAETGMKKRDVKAVAEAVLGTMGRALGDGRSLNLEPLGKVRVARTNDNGRATVLTCKIRQKAAPETTG